MTQQGGPAAPGMTAADVVVGMVAGRPRRPLVVAIDGPSAAGTSTLATTVGESLRASVVAGDDFYRDMPEDQRWALDAAGGVAEYFDWRRLHDVLMALREGRTARYRPFDWRAGQGLASQHVEVPWTPVVIVDGVYSARPELSGVVDLAVLVETPPAERQRRLVERGHGNDSWWPRWKAAEDLYFTLIRPATSFDLVVPGT